jgi:hypothetical protein
MGILVLLRGGKMNISMHAITIKKFTLELCVTKSEFVNFN